MLCIQYSVAAGPDLCKNSAMQGTSHPLARYLADTLQAEKIMQTLAVKPCFRQGFIIPPPRYKIVIDVGSKYNSIRGLLKKYDGIRMSPKTLPPFTPEYREDGTFTDASQAIIEIRATIIQFIAVNESYSMNNRGMSRLFPESYTDLQVTIPLLENLYTQVTRHTQPKSSEFESLSILAVFITDMIAYFSTCIVHCAVRPNVEEYDRVYHA